MRKVISDQSVSRNLHFILFVEMVSAQIRDPFESRDPGSNDHVINVAIIVPILAPEQGRCESAFAVAYIRWFDIVEDGDDDVIVLVLALQHLLQFHEAARAGRVVLGDDRY